MSKSNPKTAENAKQLADASRYLNGLFIVNGKSTGGAKYKDEMEKLRADYASAVPVVAIKPAETPAVVVPVKK